MTSFFNIFVVRMLWCNGPCILGKEMLAWQGRLWKEADKHMAYSLNLHALDHQTSSWELGEHTSPSTANPSRKTLLPELTASNARLVQVYDHIFSCYIWKKMTWISEILCNFFIKWRAFLFINFLKHFDQLFLKKNGIHIPF